MDARGDSAFDRIDVRTSTRLVAPAIEVDIDA